MRGFIILSLVAVSYAATLGYNYQPTSPQYNEGGSLLSEETNAALVDQSPTSVEAEYDKQFYSFAAPDEAFDDNGDSDKIAASMKKQLRVIFIRAPENKGLEQAALKVMQQSTTDHTVIYVLTKQADIGKLAQQLQTTVSENQSKPEVLFVKYRTPEDAVYAQRVIQNEYNTALPGNSRSVQGLQANVLDLASTTATTSIKDVEVEQAYLPPSPATPKDYLPPTLRRRFRS